MKILYTFLFAIVSLSAWAQAFDYNWSATNSPVNSYRFDDAFFIHPDTGWAVNFAYGSDDGYVIRTFNGGISWEKVWDSTGIAFRDIAFTDSQHGWIGTLEDGINPQDTVILYQTTDGGDTWQAVTNLPGPNTAGICGMNVVNDSTLVAVGRYPGPAHFYKTTDNGATWSLNVLDSLAGGLVDVKFFDDQTGIAVGTDGNYFTGRGRILLTEDGGSSWRVVHTSLHSQEICWKISFPSRQIGYVSLQAFANSGWQYMLKTTDGGLTWTDVNVSLGGGPFGSYNIEGIGFINDSTGWMGGDNGTFFTSDGGQNWSLETWGNTVNRFRFLNDSLAYAAGEYMYKMSRSIVSIQKPKQLQTKIYPNPTTGKVTMEYFQSEAHSIKVSLYDMKHSLVKVLLQAEMEAGNHRVFWDLGEISAGKYLYEVQIGEMLGVETLIIQR